MLDFVTGQLKGAALDRKAGKFTSFWMRDLARDFGAQGVVNPKFCFVSGHSHMPAANGVNFACGVLFVGELTTGKLSAYSIPWNPPGAGGAVQLDLLDSFPFKSPAQQN